MLSKFLEKNPIHVEFCVNFNSIISVLPIKLISFVSIYIVFSNTQFTLYLRLHIGDALEDICLPSLLVATHMSG